MKFKLISYQLYTKEGKVIATAIAFNPVEVEIENLRGTFVLSGDGVEDILKEYPKSMTIILERNKHSFTVEIKNPLYDICGNIIAEGKDVDFALDRPIPFQQFLERLM